MANSPKIILTSIAQVKLDAVYASKFGNIAKQDGLCCVSVSTDTPQPVGDEGGLAVARQRIRNYLTEYPEHATNGNLIMAIESYLIEIEGVWYDKCVIVTEWNGYELVTYSEPGYLVATPHHAIAEWLDESRPLDNGLGYDGTLGDVIHSINPEIPAGDWYNICNPFTRVEYITSVLNQINLAELIRPQIPIYPDFPRQGVEFQDLCGALSNQLKFRIIQTMITECLTVNHRLFRGVTHVVGLDARGFVLGTLVASILGAGFIMVRKQGKLPGEVIRATYMKEYGSDTFEIQQGILTRESKVLIVDDLLATGGSVRAACELIHACGVEQESLIMVGSVVHGFGPYPDHIARNLITLY
jgi:adenine phosphoribosyltransferase